MPGGRGVRRCNRREWLSRQGRVRWGCHDGVGWVVKGGFVFGNGLFVGLGVIVLDGAFDALVVPAWGLLLGFWVVMSFSPVARTIQVQDALRFRLQGYSVNPIQRDCPPATNGLLGPGQSFQIVLPVATLAAYRSDDSRIATVLLATFQPAIDRDIPGRGVSRRRTPVHVMTYLTTSWGEHMPMWPNELIALLRIAYWPGETSGVPLESLRGGNPGGNCAGASK